MQSIDSTLGLFYLQAVTFLFTLFVAWYAALKARNAAESSQEVQESILNVQKERNLILEDFKKSVSGSQEENRRLSTAVESVYINSNIRSAIDTLSRIRHILDCKLRKEICVFDLQVELPKYEELVPRCGDLSIQLDSIIDDLRKIGTKSDDEVKQLRQKVVNLSKMSEEYLKRNIDL